MSHPKGNIHFINNESFGFRFNQFETKLTILKYNRLLLIFNNSVVNFKFNNCLVNSFMHEIKIFYRG